MRLLVVIAQPLWPQETENGFGVNNAVWGRKKSLSDVDFERPSKTTSVHHLVPTPSLVIANVYRTDEVVGNARGGGYSTKAPFFVARSARKVTMP